MVLRTLIIDDEMLARQQLTDLLANDERITIIGQAANALEGIEWINGQRPDLIFLDISMPVMDGFEMLEQLDAVPYVVFTTAHSQHAAKAFELNAVDYIVKPVSPDRLYGAIDKVAKEIWINEKSDAGNHKLGLQSRVFIKDGERFYFVTVADIFFIRTVGSYSKLYFQDKAPLLAKSLSFLEERLPNTVFFRANRTEIINIHYIKKIYPAASRGALVAELANGEQVEISTRQSSKFRQMLSL